MPLDNYEDYNQFVTAMMIAHASKSATDIEMFIAQSRLAGMSDDVIEALLIADLDAGGILFGAYSNGIATTLKDSIQLSANVASINEYLKAGITMFRWITVNGEKACPDCQPRAGRLEDIDLWHEIGTPGSGWSVCRNHCACELAPEDYEGKTTFQKTPSQTI